MTALAVLALAVTGYSQLQELPDPSIPPLVIPPTPPVPSSPKYYQIDTNNLPSTVPGALELIAKTVYDAVPTNFVVVGYGTYAPDAPSKYGGGGLILYNISQNLGAGIGGDWLGKFTLVSGQFEFKLPIFPLRPLGTSSFFQNFQVTPWAMTGISAPVGGAGQQNGNVSGIVGAGANLDLFNLGKGWRMGVGGGLVNVSGAGDYSGKHYHAYLEVSRGL